MKERSRFADEEMQMRKREKRGGFASLGGKAAVFINEQSECLHQRGFIRFPFPFFSLYAIRISSKTRIFEGSECLKY